MKPFVRIWVKIDRVITTPNCSLKESDCIVSVSTKLCFSFLSEIHSEISWYDIVIDSEPVPWHICFKRIEYVGWSENSDD